MKNGTQGVLRDTREFSKRCQDYTAAKVDLNVNGTTMTDAQLNGRRFGGQMPAKCFAENDACYRKQLCEWNSATGIGAHIPPGEGHDTYCLAGQPVKYLYRQNKGKSGYPGCFKWQYLCDQGCSACVSRQCSNPVIPAVLPKNMARPRGPGWGKGGTFGPMCAYSAFVCSG